MLILVIYITLLEVLDQKKIQFYTRPKNTMVGDEMSRNINSVTEQKVPLYQITVTIKMIENSNTYHLLVSGQKTQSDL